MSVVPQEKIQDWYDQYEDPAFWAEYPEVDPDELLFHIDQDRDWLFQYCVEPARETYEGEPPIYLATAGAPLAGKSTILDVVLKEDYPIMGKIDPDVWGMALMNAYNAYMMSPAMKADPDGFEHAQQRAYNVVRPASNYLTLEMMNYLAMHKLHIAHGTTSTSSGISTLWGNLKSQGYRIDALLCGAEDEMRAEAQQYRSQFQGNHQSTPADVINKGKAFPLRFGDYFSLAHNLEIFWREGVTQTAVHAASYSKGQRIVHDQDAFDKFADKYRRDREAWLAPRDGSAPQDLPLFDQLEQRYSQREFTLPALSEVARPEF